MIEEINRDKQSGREGRCMWVRRKAERKRKRRNKEIKDGGTVRGGGLGFRYNVFTLNQRTSSHEYGVV
jgi:hypothetical protein